MVSSRDFYRVLYGTHEGIQHIRNSFGPAGLSQARSFHGMAKDSAGRASGPTHGTELEKLLFVNHTECECQPINDMPRLQEKPKEQQDAHNPQEPQDGSFHQQSKCRECPVPFCKREFPDGRCSCDCFDRQKPCLRIKRGREPLPEVERRCIDAGLCHVPDCEFGPFDVSSGRCPKRPDDFQRKNNCGYSRGQQNNYNHHRWTFFERD